jgi:hypothetical protein
MFRIHSVNSDRELIFSKSQGNRFEVEICGSTLRCAISVWHDDTYPNVDEFFKELAASGKPWDGERKWKSLEGDFKISATCSRTGNVHLSVDVNQQMGSDEESSIKTGLVIEFGQLNSISEGMSLVFKK